MTTRGPSVHASAVLVGDRAVLIRGPSGSGKSRLAFDLILAGRGGQIPPAVLVGDDRVHLETVAGQLWSGRRRELAGLIEIRGLGIRRCDFVAQAASASWSIWRPRCRAPAAAGSAADHLYGVEIPRIPVGRGYSPLPLVVAALTTTEGSASVQPSGDCLKGIGNHISPTIATE